MACKEVSKDDEAVLNAIFNPHTPFIEDNVASSTEDPPPHSTVLSEELKNLEIEAINAAQKGDLITSLNLFNRLVNEAPRYASGFNNRAQLFRIQGDNESAIDDLNKAILLSQGKGYAASQAFVQRGVMYKLHKEDEKAYEDFKSAAKLGNSFAKSQLATMNPYAALCNQMLGEVFSKIYKGEPDLV